MKRSLAVTIWSPEKHDAADTTPGLTSDEAEVFKAVSRSETQQQLPFSPCAWNQKASPGKRPLLSAGLFSIT